MALTKKQREKRQREIERAQAAIAAGNTQRAQTIVNNMTGGNVGGARAALNTAIQQASAPPPPPTLPTFQAPSVTYNGLDPNDGSATYSPGDYQPDQSFIDWANSIGAQGAPGGGGGNNTPPRSLVSIDTVYEAGYNVTYNVYSDGSRVEIRRELERTAGDAVEDMFRNLGLGDAFAASLKGIIDRLYQSNVKPTQAEILNTVYTSEPYKQRFKANEVIRQRMANGQGRPGDRMLTPAEYIEAEGTYRTILADRDMPIGFYDSPDDFTNLIANSISANEFQSRVDTAYDALNFADDNVLGALRDFYGMSNSDLAAYLLDPARAMPILEGRARSASTGAYDLNSRTELQRMYGISTVAGMGRRQGLQPGQEMAGEIFDLGRTKAETESAFAKAAEQAPDVERLGKLYGESMDFKDIVREDLNLSGGAASGRKRRKFASKERAQFGQRSALGSTSLRDRTDV